METMSSCVAIINGFSNYRVVHSKTKHLLVAAGVVELVYCSQSDVSSRALIVQVFNLPRFVTEAASKSSS